MLVESISGLHGPEHNIRDKGVNQSGGYSQTCEIIKPASSLLYTMGKYGKMMEHQLCKRSMASKEDTFGMATSHLPPSDKCATHRHTIVAPLTSPPLLEGLRNCEHWKCCQGYKGVNNSASNKSCLDMLGHLFTWVCCSSSSKLCRFCSAPVGKEAIPGLCQNHHVPRLPMSRKTKLLDSGPAVKSSALRS